MTFTEEAAARGIDHLYRSDLRRAKMISTMGGGVAAADYDGDGDVDLYLVSGVTNAVKGSGDAARLYRNRGDGTFEDVAASAGVALTAWSMGAVFADYDGDGHLDLFVTCLGPDVLYRNRGDGTFEDATARAGVGDPRFGAGAAFADLDGDGDLDLVVVNYLASSVEAEMAAPALTIRVPADYEGEPSVLYENRGDGTFADVTARAGLDNREGKGLGVRCFDADADGRIDVFVANDTVPNKLYRNRGDGTFEDVGLVSGTALSAQGNARAGMGIALGDADGDGGSDLFVTNFASEPNSLFRSVAAGIWAEETDDSLVQASLPYVGWGTSFFDADLDGDEDLAVANGHLMPGFVRKLGRASKPGDDVYLQGPWKGPVHLFRNEGGRFMDTTGKAGDLSSPDVEVAARGLVTADVDGDGDLDVAVNGRDPGSMLFVNHAEKLGRHWLAIAPRMPGKNPFAIGARVEVTPAGGRTMRRTICAGSSYLSSEPPEAHFGLGEATRVEEVRIVWPDGRAATLRDVAPDRRVTLFDEGAGGLVEIADATPPGR